jgi:hypothetical protein
MGDRLWTMAMVVLVVLLSVADVLKLKWSVLESSHAPLRIWVFFSELAPKMRNLASIIYAIYGR